MSVSAATISQQNKAGSAGDLNNGHYAFFLGMDYGLQEETVNVKRPSIGAVSTSCGSFDMGF